MEGKGKMLKVVSVLH